MLDLISHSLSKYTWEVLPHSLYSPDIASPLVPIDDTRPIRHFIWKYQKMFDSWIASKDADFFRYEIQYAVRKMKEKVIAMDNTLNKKHSTIFHKKATIFAKNSENLLLFILQLILFQLIFCKCWLIFL